MTNQNLAFVVLVAVWLFPACCLCKQISVGEQQFATHFLYIITDTDEMGKEEKTAMVSNAQQAFVSNLPFLITEKLLSALQIHEKKQLSTSYRYFKIPAQIPNPPFLLCIPSSMLPTIIDPAPNEDIENMIPFRLGTDETYSPETVSSTEKKCGLLVGHFYEVTKQITQGSYKLSSSAYAPTELGVKLRSILQVIFVPNDAYSSSTTCPRWILVFDGHGRQYKPYSDEEILKDENHKFIKSYGLISGIDSKNFSLTIRELSKKITIVHMHINTCFGGVINIGNLLYDVETGVIPPYRFTITTRTLTGDACVPISDTPNQLGKFYNTLKNVQILNVDEMLESPLFRASKIAKIYEIALKNVYEKIPKALSYLAPANSLSFPAIKPAETNYFVELQVEDGLPLKRIDAKTVKEYYGKELECDPWTLFLFYTTSIPFTLRAHSGTGFLSAIPGSTFHIIEKMEISPLFSENLTLIFRDTLQKKDHVTKLFHIKTLTIGDNEYEMWITKEPESYTILQASKADPVVFTITEKNIVKISKETWEMNEKIIPAEEAAAWIKKFDDKIIFLKKLANAQAPYRFLKDADIETLPWDA